MSDERQDPAGYRLVPFPLARRRIGMFGKTAGWGIPMTVYTLTVTLGGIAPKPWVVDGRIEPRDILSVTVSVDHDIVDGAPLARFASRFSELIEKGHGLPPADPRSLAV